MAAGTFFRPVLDAVTSGEDATRIVLCSGKHFYTLSERLAKSKNPTQIALIRIEELSPFPASRLSEILAKYDQANEVVWAQEEPANQGPWTFLRPRLEDVLECLGRMRNVRYAGRGQCPTVAVGVGDWHKRESEEILLDALE